MSGRHAGPGSMGAGRMLLVLSTVATVSVGCGREVDGPGSLPNLALARGSEGSVEATPAQLRRLWGGSDFNFYASSPSPDGRYVTEIDWSTGDLAVRDLVTGQLHRLTDKGGWETSGDYADPSHFSPDGRRIAYSWNHDATKTYQVRLVDFTVDDSGIPHGSEPVIIHQGGPQYVYWLYGWSSDDEILVGIYRPDNSAALAFLSLSDGSLRVLKSFDWEDAHAVLSPDGALVAYDHPPASDNRERDINLISADGTRETTLIDFPGRDMVLGWTPSGSALLFHSEASGTPSIWRLPMSGDQPAGPPEIVQQGVRNLEPLGFAGDDYYFGSAVEAPLFRIARIDVEGRRLIPTVTPTDSEGGWDVPRSMDWSPDGEHIIQNVPRGPTRSTFVVKREDGSLVREWDAGFRLRRWYMRWTPDGRALVVSGQDDRGRAGFFRVDLASGEHEVLRHFDPETGQGFSLSPDGSTLYFTRASPDQPESGEIRIDIVARDLVSGDERPVHTIRDQNLNLGLGHSSPFAPTPDGRGLAYPGRGSDGERAIQLLEFDGGDVRTLHRLPGLGHELLGWGPEGEHLFFLVHLQEADDVDWSVLEVELWRVSSQGGDAERIAVIEDYFGGARLHPDGRTITYRAGRHRGEIWALHVSEANTRTDPGVDR